MESCGKRFSEVTIRKALLVVSLGCSLKKWGTWKSGWLRPSPDLRKGPRGEAALLRVARMGPGSVRVPRDSRRGPWVRERGRERVEVAERYITHRSAPKTHSSD